MTIVSHNCHLRNRAKLRKVTTLRCQHKPGSGVGKPITEMLNAKVPVSKIAADIGRHRSTVYREIKRNYFTDEELPDLSGYYGMIAQKYAADRRARRRKLIRLEDRCSHVIAHRKIGWTPEQIAGRLGYDGQPVRVSHETTYAYVYSAEGQFVDCARWTLPLSIKVLVQ
ncbi:MAG: helix-turn-helix domain-containing protein [Tateyamaria sp.]|uniref:helix-turn-helix domain-containing protein n=1 Tax=Tateyamaria sp. TaxID=1929288 RepID=UPI0032A0105F